MQKPKLTTAPFTQPAPEVFEAVLGVVQNGKFTLAALDNERHRIAFSSGKTALSWGHDYLVEVAQGATGAELSLVCGGVDGAPAALMDGWKNGKAAGKVVAAVNDVVNGVTTAHVTPTESFGVEMFGQA